MHWDRHPPGRQPWANPPSRQTATAADGGTHPTGMHSCLVYVFLSNSPN